MFVICTLPNASDEINGIPFEDHKDGKISKVAVSAEVAEAFAQIDGYTVIEAKAKAGKKDAKPAEAPVVDPVPPVVEGEQ